MELQVRRSNRIELSELIALLKGKREDIFETMLLSPQEAQSHWITDADLYKACMVIRDESLKTAALSKALETFIVVPASAVGEEKRPLNENELEALKETYTGDES